MSRKVRQILMAVLLLLVVRMYFQYSHIAYGTPWTRQGCERSKWFGSWDYDCKRYMDLDVKPALPVPTVAAPNLGDPIAVTIATAPAKNPEDPPAAENVDPLEHENKLNEPAPHIDQDHLNSNADRLNEEMKKAVTMPGNDAPKDNKNKEDDEHVAGHEAAPVVPSVADSLKMNTPIPAPQA
ncbi:Dolichyl-phosphate-mannose--protein mannosyltransferase 1 [Linderina macrospora]|uniref:Dolichyl-phosphate-mannose--protein mannosyltransferase 1 n=1 Tax=Linderina macrospora TaxID=4868 RepID=A0ACC1JAE5_9FUNG|nr:Dolichyl-phosphate-mannose--protein mannosyltransferase 1 [Linderina macrospora]